MLIFWKTEGECHTKLSFLIDKSSCLTSLTFPTVMFHSSNFQTTAGGTCKLKEKYSSGPSGIINNNLASSIPKDDDDKNPYLM